MKIPVFRVLTCQFLILFVTHLLAQVPANIGEDVDVDKIIDSLIQKGYQEGLIPGISAGLVFGDSIYYYNYGQAKIEVEIPITSSTKFQWGSVGKLLTSISVLQLVEKGQLDLHTDISKYWQQFELDSENDSDVMTLHCLLTHTCGFNDVNIGYMAHTTEEVLPLSEYLQMANPGLFQSPGREIVYSNFSYALAGRLVEIASGLDFKTYISRFIFEPLEMTMSTLEFPEDYISNPEYANGYRKTDNGFEAVHLFPRHAIPAGSLVSTSMDMAKFSKALLAQNDALLSAESWQLFFTNQETNHPSLTGYAYGLERQNINGTLSWAKGGMLPGMLSNVFIIPGQLAFFSSVNTNHDVFGEYFFKSLMDILHPNKTSIGNKAAFNTTPYSGVYRDKRYNHDNVEKAATLFRGAFEIYDNTYRDTLLVFHNGQFQEYVPTDAGVFQCVDLPYEYLVFEKNNKGQVETMYRNVNINGLSVPTSFEKTNWYNSPEFVNDQYPFVPAIIIFGLFFIIGTILLRGLRFWKKDFMEDKLFPISYHILMSSIVLIVLFHSAKGFFLLFRNTEEFLFGYPSIYLLAQGLAYLLIPLVLAFIYALWKVTKEYQGNRIGRLYGALFSIATVVHIAFLFYWNFI
ncbi:MAG: beta-lactamase family protein [Bacteroidia bacterium]|nr:beta-lactamase family protein [Bacteroidia bacterium]